MAMIIKNNKDWKIVVVTPAGRERHLSVLRKYIEKEMDKGLIDGWQLWKNTNIQSDVDYLYHMANENPKIEVKEIAGLGSYDGYNICKFFQFAQDDDTIYLRVDDDIVWIEDGAILNLINYRLENREPFIVCANIVNNTVIGRIHQNIGALSKEVGECSGERLDSFAHRDEKFAELTHKTFRELRESSRLWIYHFIVNKLSAYEPFSISCFAFFGKDHFAPAPDEEMWISSYQPNLLSRPNVICGSSLVVHYAYYTQRPFLDSKPEYHDYYKKLSEQL